MKINSRPAPLANWLRWPTRILPVLAVAVVLAIFTHPAAALAQQRKLASHVQEAVKRLRPLGRKPATETMDLSLGLRLRNEDLMDQTYKSQYDPASTNFHKWLTPEQFSEQFGPTEADYQKVLAFAKASGFKVTGQFGSRRLLKVSGTVAQVEKAFQVKMMIYQHPTEARQFFAPDTEPSVDASIPVLTVGKLNNFDTPRPTSHLVPRPAGGSPQGSPQPLTNGSEPDGHGGYFGSDFRVAYLGTYAFEGNVGSGQQIGVLQYSQAITPDDFHTYASQMGLSGLGYYVQYYDGTSGYGLTNGEASLDVEMALAMAPGAVITTFVGSDNPPNTVLDAMVQDPACLQFSASWEYDVDDTSEGYFRQMAMQGQSFFNSSGDSDSQTATFLHSGFSLADTNITIVGGTELVTDANHNYVSESVWNDRTPNPHQGYWGSTGGVTQYGVPSWQISALAGSYTNRCTPDVALVANHVYTVYYKNGTSGHVSDDTGGTSCAAPLWAGYMALVNAQAAAAGKPSAGFINPAIYSIYSGGGGTNLSYAQSFNDTTAGDNTWPSMPSQYFASAGYDLCTGLGTPTSGLIYALSGTLSTVWVHQPGSFFPSFGTFADPFYLLTEGVANVPANGYLILENGSASPGPIRITKPMHISAFGGTSTIGP